MSTMRAYVLLLASLSLLGCATHQTAALSSGGGLNFSFAGAGRSGPDSLFPSDTAVLSDDAIRQILAHRYFPEERNRIAVIALERGYRYGWADESALLGVEVQSALVDRLKSSPLVYDAAYLPTLLMPEMRTIGYFREAAARYQADLLLIYTASFQTYEKRRAFKSDKSRSYCNVQAVLLDIRTGIIPFTVTASRDYVVEASEGDFGLTETARRSEVQALRDALVEVGDAAVAFLQNANQSTVD